MGPEMGVVVQQIRQPRRSMPAWIRGSQGKGTGPPSENETHERRHLSGVVLRYMTQLVPCDETASDILEGGRRQQVWELAITNGATGCFFACLWFFD